MIGAIFIKDRLLQSGKITLFLRGLGFLHEPVEMLWSAPASERHQAVAVVLNLPEADISIRILNSKNYLQPAHHLFFPLLAGFYDESI